MIHNVQVLRFLAAAGVAFGHMGGLLIATGPDEKWLWWVGTAGVDLFFVISGFIMVCISQSAFGEPGAGWKFLKRRAIRIVPPYWFFTTLTIALVLLLGGRIGGTTLDPGQIVTSYGFVPWPRADGQLKPILSQGWTLNYEAFFYLAFAVSLWRRRGLVWLCAAFLLLAAGHVFVPETLFVLKFWSFPIILEFLGGIALAKIYLRGVRLAPAAQLACVAAAVLLFIALWGIQAGPFSGFLNRGIPALLLAASFILAPEPAAPGRVRRWLHACGDASYTLYLSHYMVVNAFAILWRRLAPNYPWLGVAMGMGVAIAAALLFFRTVERPVTEALHRRFDSRPRALETVAP
jgi:peptidoglycan/LPS O-acetylase OafA/YrhL